MTVCCRQNLTFSERDNENRNNRNNTNNTNNKYNKYKYYYIPQLRKNRNVSPYELLIISPVYREIEGHCVKDDIDSIESFFKTMSI